MGLFPSGTVLGYVQRHWTSKWTWDSSDLGKQCFWALNELRSIITTPTGTHVHAHISIQVLQQVGCNMSSRIAYIPSVRMAVIDRHGNCCEEMISCLTHASVRARARTHTHTHTCTNTNTHTQTQKAYTHAHTHTHAHKLTHTHCLSLRLASLSLSLTHTHTHTHARTHTHTINTPSMTLKIAVTAAEYKLLRFPHSVSDQYIDTVCWLALAWCRMYRCSGIRRLTKEWFVRVCSWNEDTIEH